VAIGFAWPHLRRDWPVLLRRAPILLALSVTGIASFNTMVYIGLQDTTAVNALLPQSVMPLVILLWAFVFYRERPGLFQMAGVAVSLLGVAAIAGRGSLAALVNLSFNIGDVWVTGAVVLYALLRGAPAVPASRAPAQPSDGLGGHRYRVAAAVLSLGGWLSVGVWRGRDPCGWPSYAAVAYTAVLPSLAAYLFFNRGVELIGAARAGQSLRLLPAFGAALAVIFLGERI